MTAVSLSHPPCLPPAEMHAALPAFPSPRPITPFESLDEHHFAHAKALRVLPVGERLEKSEAHGMFTLWAQLGLVVNSEYCVICGDDAVALTPLSCRRFRRAIPRQVRRVGR